MLTSLAIESRRILTAGMHCASQRLERNVLTFICENFCTACLSIITSLHETGLPSGSSAHAHRPFWRKPGGLDGGRFGKRGRERKFATRTSSSGSDRRFDLGLRAASRRRSERGAPDYIPRR